MLHPKVKVPVIVMTILGMIGAVASAVGAGVPEAVPVVTLIVALIGGVTGYLMPAETSDGKTPVLKVEVPTQVLSALTLGTVVLTVVGGEIPAAAPITMLAATIVQRLLGYMTPSDA